MNNKKISIIIPCHNSSQTLDDAWNSLKKQTLGIENIECIFVDDASDDDGKTWKKLTDIEQECPESVMIIHLEENLRQGGARNVGISYASGEYILFLDSDDELILETCKKLYELADKNKSDIIQFNHIYKLGNESKTTSESPFTCDYEIKNKEDRVKFLDASLVTYGCTNKLYRLDIIKKADAKFAEKVIYEEPLFVYPCFLYAKRVSLITDAFYVYNFHQGSTVTSLLGKRVLDHPKVQLLLLEYWLSRPDIFVEYKDVFELYFLWSYYCETICFAFENKVVLPLDYFKGMQEVCIKFFSDWKRNQMMKRIPQNVVEVLQGINHSFNSQEELTEYIQNSANKL